MYCVECGNQGAKKFNEQSLPMCEDCMLLTEERARSAKFWAEKVSWKFSNDLTEDGQMCVRANGTHYTIGDDTSVLKGHGGRRWIVEFVSGPHKGQKITTTDLWCQGDIPADIRAFLPDNAVLSQPAEDLLSPFEKVAK